MKTEINKPYPFQPRSLTLHFETQDELDALGILFDTREVDCLLPEGLGRAEIGIELQKLGANIHNERFQKIYDLMPVSNNQKVVDDD